VNTLGNIGTRDHPFLADEIEDQNFVQFPNKLEGYDGPLGFQSRSFPHLEEKAQPPRLE
jgi:hypothetical protein